MKSHFKRKYLFNEVIRERIYLFSEIETIEFRYLMGKLIFNFVKFSDSKNEKVNYIWSPSYNISLIYFFQKVKTKMTKTLNNTTIGPLFIAIDAMEKKVSHCKYLLIFIYFLVHINFSLILDCE